MIVRTCANAVILFSSNVLAVAVVCPKAREHYIRISYVS